MQKEDEKVAQKLRMRKIGFKKDLPVNPQFRIVFSASCRPRLQIYVVFNELIS